MFCDHKRVFFNVTSKQWIKENVVPVVPALSTQRNKDSLLQPIPTLSGESPPLSPTEPLSFSDSLLMDDSSNAHDMCAPVDDTSHDAHVPCMHQHAHVHTHTHTHTHTCTRTICFFSLLYCVVMFVHSLCFINIVHYCYLGTETCHFYHHPMILEQRPLKC